jgi:hypothetical protein
VGFFGRLGKSISSIWSGGMVTGASVRDQFGPDAAPTKPEGADGVAIYSGYLATSETNPELVGLKKWVTYTNATNSAVVATGLRAFGWLLAGTTWHAEPNKLGGKQAKRGAELVDKGLINAQMPKPWSTTVRKHSMYRFNGFALHEWLMRRDADGDMVFADLQHRPPYTINRWDRPDPQGQIQGVTQLTRDGRQYYIPRGRLFYSVDDTLSDNPDGVGVLRHVVELVRRLEFIERLEVGAYQTDLRGMPIGFAPLAEIMNSAPGGPNAPGAAAWAQQQCAQLTTVLQNAAKNPEKAMYLLLDSAPFRGLDPNVISSIMKWQFQLLKGESNGLPDVAKLIERLHLIIARILGIEFALVGGGNSRGSYGMHADKTDMFATNLQATLNEQAAQAELDLARTLVAYNGLDPDEATPQLIAEPVSTDAILSVAQALAALAQAGGVMPPNWDGWDVLLQRARLPPLPDITPAMAGALRPQPPGKPKPPDDGPDPTAGEEEVDLRDLGDSKEAA